MEAQVSDQLFLHLQQPCRNYPKTVLASNVHLGLEPWFLPSINYHIFCAPVSELQTCPTTTRGFSRIISQPRLISICPLNQRHHSVSQSTTRLEATWVLPAWETPVPTSCLSLVLRGIHALNRHVLPGASFSLFYHWFQWEIECADGKKLKIIIKHRGDDIIEKK